MYKVLSFFGILTLLLSIFIFSSGKAYATSGHVSINCPGIVYSPGKVWNPGQGETTTACSGRTLHLVYQTDGNFVLYCNATAIFATNNGVARQYVDYASFQKDGNLVVYLYNRVGGVYASWSSGTYGQGATQLVLQGDGNLVIYNGSHTALWASDTSGQC